MWEVQMEIYLSHYKKYGFHCITSTNIANTHCGHVLYQNQKLGKNIQIFEKFNLYRKYAYCRGYFHRIHAYSTAFCKDLYTKLHCNPPNCLVTGTSSLTDDHVVSPQDILFYRY